MPRARVRPKQLATILQPRTFHAAACENPTFGSDGEPAIAGEQARHGPLPAVSGRIEQKGSRLSAHQHAAVGNRDRLRVLVETNRALRQFSPAHIIFYADCVGAPQTRSPTSPRTTSRCTRSDHPSLREPSQSSIGTSGLLTAIPTPPETSATGPASVTSRCAYAERRECRQRTATRESEPVVNESVGEACGATVHHRADIAEREFGHGIDVARSIEHHELRRERRRRGSERQTELPEREADRVVAGDDRPPYARSGIAIAQPRRPVSTRRSLKGRSPRLDR